MHFFLTFRFPLPGECFVGGCRLLIWYDHHFTQLLIGGMINSQPTFIKGIPDLDGARNACFEGAALYFATMALSLFVWYRDDRKSADERFQLHDHDHVNGDL